ncbi:hypothetical protein V12G01_07743 [Vibrio alginolyticus 12G01]|uniref:hypothetical protein n=1 Tax=Vibrio alginolyticus TaxID=663 RepID=UPI0000D54023|nr:hypothetical protein [Vibrio alginolyticus]EAS76772.1 hypothetical protein V12G01_07743 [Vibrio alginolyticus 12G01]
MKKLVACVLLAASTTASAGFFNSDTDKALDTVRESVPGSCNHEVGEMVDAYFTDAKWKASKAKSGRLFVNVEGDVNYRNQEQHAFMQFEVDGEEFWLNVLKLNGRQQSNMMMRSFANHMCDAVK